MYEVMMKISDDDIYNKLSPEEKDMFDTVVITDVTRHNINSVIIYGIGVEKKVPKNTLMRNLLEK